LKTVKFFPILLAALIFSACVKNYEKPLATTQYSPLLAVPLINSNLTVKDLLVKDNKGGTIHTDSNNFLTLIYQGKLFSLQADSIIKFPTQSYSYNTPALTAPEVTAFNALSIGSNYTVPAFTDTVVFNTNGTANVDTVIFRTTTFLNLTISSQFPQNATVTITVPSAKKGGIPLTQTFPLTYTGTLPVTVNANIDVSGYTFDMTEGGTTSSKFNITFAVTLNKSNATPITVADNASMTVGFTNPLFLKIFGYIKQPLLSPNLDTVPITIFNNVLPGGGTFTLVNPSVTFILNNSYGVPINATFSTLEGYSPGHPPYPITITTPSLNPWQLPYPTILQIGQIITDSATISNATTANTLGNAINNTPKNFVYSVNAQANPLGKPLAPATNFALDTSRFVVNFKLYLPFWGTASNIMLMDTIPFSLSGNNTNAIQSLQFKINATNGFPVDMGMQLYFTDSISPTQKYNVLDSLISPYQEVLPSALVDTTNGTVLAATNRITECILDKTRVNNVANCKKMILKATFVTFNSGKTNVKIFSTYFIDLKIGVLAQLQTRI
jgi:hypothetical protein